MKQTIPLFAALAVGLAVPVLADGAPDVPPIPSDEAAPAFHPAPPPDAPLPPPDGGPAMHRRGRRGPGGQDGPGGGPNGLGLLVPLLRQGDTAAKIGLDEDKAAALLSVLADLDAEARKLNERLPAAIKRQADALHAETIDEEAVLAAVNDLWDLRRDIAIVQTRTLVAIRSALDERQLAAARRLVRESLGGPHGGNAREPGGDHGPKDRQGPNRRMPPRRGRHAGPPPPADGDDAPAAEP